MKLHNRIAAVVAAVALCAGAFTASASADEVSLKIAGQHPIDHFGTEALNQIEADLEAANAGLSVKTFPAGQLGYGEQVFGDVAAGAIDIGHTFIYSHNDPRLEINGLPFMVSTYDQMRAAFSPGSAFYTTFEELLDGQGVKLLGIFIEGFIGVATAKAPENATTTGPKGVNIRIWSAEVAHASVTAMGFNTTTMNWGDVPAAIQQGTVDGLVGGTAESYYTIFRDIITHFIPYKAFVENTAYYMNKGKWESLNAAQQEAVSAAFQKASAWSFDQIEKVDAEYTQKLADHGVTVVAISDEELAAMGAEVVASVQPLLVEKFGADLMARLQADSN